MAHPIRVRSIRLALASLLAASAIGCAGPKVPVSSDVPPQFGYIPFDPLPVQVDRGVIPKNDNQTFDPMLSILPDETVRIAITKFDARLGITYAVAKAEAEQGSYRVTLDYMKFTTDNLKLAQTQSTPDGDRVYSPYSPEEGDKDAPVIVPVYVGVGLRIIAEVNVTGGSVNLGSLFAIGAAAEAKRLTGTLMVQSLGIGGPAVSGTLPMPNEINQTTIANAMTALSTIKSKIWDDGTSINPRVLGIYNTIGGDNQTVNGLVGCLLLAPPRLPLAATMVPQQQRAAASVEKAEPTKELEPVKQPEPAAAPPPRKPAGEVLTPQGPIIVKRRPVLDERDMEYMAAMRREGGIEATSARIKEKDMGKRVDPPAKQP